MESLSPSFHWSGRRVSNPQPSAWKADALPVELLPLSYIIEPPYSTGGVTRSTGNIPGFQQAAGSRQGAVFIE